MKHLAPGFFLRGLDLFFGWLYTSLAWAYDPVAATVSFGRWQKWVLAALPYASPSPALELGFGPGHLQAALHGQGYPVFGVDASLQMCRRAGKRIRRARGEPRIARATAEQLPFADESFSRILATFPAPYILSPLTARETHRLLRPGGLLVVLLSVQMNGATLPERGMRALLRWTGQQPEADHRYLSTLFDIYREVGFSIRAQWQPCGADRLFFLFMEKPGFIIKEI